MRDAAPAIVPAQVGGEEVDTDSTEWQRYVLPPRQSRATGTV